MILFHEIVKCHFESDEIEAALMNDEHIALTALEPQEL
jgi:hypothetical protein